MYRPIETNSHNQKEATMGFCNSPARLFRLTFKPVTANTLIRVLSTNTRTITNTNASLRVVDTFSLCAQAFHVTYCCNNNSNKEKANKDKDNNGNKQ